MIVDRILQYPLEEHRKLGRRFLGVFLRQLEHRVLDYVERRMLVADCEHRLLERTAFDFREKGRKFLGGGQKGVRYSRWRAINSMARHYRAPSEQTVVRRNRLDPRQAGRYGSAVGRERPML